MNPEIKAAIAKEAHKASIQVAERFNEGFEICVHDVVKTANYRFKDGAEYGYKLGLAHGRYLERTYSGGAVTRIEQLKKELQEILDER